MKDHLVRHLYVLTIDGRARPEIRSQDSILAGASAREEMKVAIENSDLALLLISASYLAEPFINDVELPTLLKRREEGGLEIIPVILRSCYWDAHPALGGMQPIPRDGKSIAGRNDDGQDEQYVQVAKAIAAEFQRRQVAVRGR
jgi:hypothetical protein